MKTVAVSIEWKESDEKPGISNPYGTTVVVAPNLMYALDHFTKAHPFRQIDSAREVGNDVMIMGDPA